MSQGTRSIPFRPDVEGLRGVAILLVVLYHAGVPWVGGGYVGVDVFFVLSGYLITQILLVELEGKGRIDLVRFYARRIRRLLPASALVVVGTVAASYILQAPYEQVEIASSALATAAYVSNVYFAQVATDYLAGAAADNPLLHTWSLAVEEQFYLLWPLVVGGGAAGLAAFTAAGGARVDRRRVALAMALLAGASLALCLVWTASVQPRAFFLTPARAWEFALGGLGALAPLQGRAAALTGTGRPLAGWLGLAGIVAAAVLFDAETPFPGAAALLPACATVLVLRAGVDRSGAVQSGTLLSRAMGARPLQEAGRLSYSWYLWHWPVLVFYRLLVPDVTTPQLLAAAMGSVLLAAGSYHLVEQPIRRGRWAPRTNRSAIAMGVAITAVSLGVGAVWGRVATGESLRADQVRYTEAAADRPAIYNEDCIADYFETEVLECGDSGEGPGPLVVLFGDSHAAQWHPALAAAAEAQGWRFVSVTKSACPVADVSFSYAALGRAYTECDAWRAAALDHIERLRPDAVVMVSSVGYASGLELVTLDEWERGQERVFERLRGAGVRAVHLVDNPLPRQTGLRCLARSTWYRTTVVGRLAKPTCEIEGSLALDGRVVAAERRAASRAGATVLDFTDAFCPGDTCPGEIDGVVVYRDSNHITATFARQMADAFVAHIAPVVAAGARREGAPEA